MIQRLCQRCHTVLQIEDEGTLIYCWNCGAPQITLSEELKEQAQQTELAARTPAGDTAETESERAARIAAQPPDLLVVWKSVIRISAAVAAALSVLSILLPPLELLAWIAPSIVLGIYCVKHRETRITAAVGARVGILCGILSGFGITVATAAQMLALRFALHKGNQFEDAMTPALLQAKARAAAQSGQAIADRYFNPFLNVPEFRVGLVLLMLSISAAILLVLSTAGGAFSGYMRSRAQTR